jgi:hypothetical protein
MPLYVQPCLDHNNYTRRDLSAGLGPGRRSLCLGTLVRLCLYSTLYGQSQVSIAEKYWDTYDHYDFLDSGGLWLPYIPLCMDSLK